MVTHGFGSTPLSKLDRWLFLKLRANPLAMAGLSTYGKTPWVPYYPATKMSLPSSPLEGETMAAVFALSETLDCNITYCVLEEDSKQVIDKLKEEAVNSEIANSMDMVKSPLIKLAGFAFNSLPNN
ncbi:hypothetical protein PanWU01x14_156860 [Parasponia andersonii]|uniref:RNase H type-1 domain-containing protein n=1 Tax=Parasponia andersonii TaxID=3476 RepID=A0A2P5CFG2_PARAD|nr:hypothetical protein PanWU01x14_156860 [Parasponia andersonii]